MWNFMELTSCFWWISSDFHPIVCLSSIFVVLWFRTCCLAGHMTKGVQGIRMMIEGTRNRGLMIWIIGTICGICIDLTSTNIICWKTGCSWSHNSWIDVGVIILSCRWFSECPSSCICIGIMDFNWLIYIPRWSELFSITEFSNNSSSDFTLRTLQKLQRNFWNDSNNK